MTLGFTHPLLLLFLWPILLLPLFWLYTHSRSEDQLAAFMAAHLQASLRPSRPGARTMRHAGWMTAGLLLLVVAAAGPHSTELNARGEAAGQDLVLVLDVSRSMLAKDSSPNRLERARNELRRLIARISNGRIGLVTFRHTASLSCPLTRDRNFLQQTLAAAGPHCAARGETDIASGLMLAIDLLTRQDTPHGTIVLVSDGENLSGDLAAAVQAVADAGIRCITIGIGTPEGDGIPSPESPRDAVRFEGQTVRTQRRDAVLRNIATATGGACIIANENPAYTAADLCQAYLRDIARDQTPSAHRSPNRQHYPWVLLPALACFFASAWSARQRPARPRSPTRIGLLAIAALLGMYTASAAAQTVASPISRFNAAANLFHAREYEQAADLLERMRPVSELSDARIQMALGCSLYRLAESMEPQDRSSGEEHVRLLQRAANAFRNGLRIEPENAVAATNLAVAVRAFTQASLRLPEPETATPESPAPSSAGKADEDTQPPAEHTTPDTAPQGSATQASINNGSNLPATLSAADIAELLESALQREEEYRIETQRRGRDAGPAPGLRDW